MNYQDHYVKALNPTSGDLKTNLLSELRSYFQLSLADDELYHKCKNAPDAILQEWRKQKIDPTDKTAVTTFYVDTKLYCYELLALETDAPVDRQEQLAEFLALLKQHRKMHGLDYGSGIGTLGIYLNQNGIHCDFADVSETNLQFISERLQRRGLHKPQLINLMKKTVPAGQYDFITAFDVIEHITDPLGFISEIAGKLRDGGLFVFNLLGGEEDTPHILRDVNLVRKHIRGFGLAKVGTIGEFKIYRKVARPAVVNRVLGLLDRAFWSFRESIQKLKG